MRSVLLLYLTLFCITVNAEDFYYKNNKKVSLTPLDTNATQTRNLQKNRDTRYYMTPQQKVVGVKDEIILSTTKIEKVVQSYDITPLRELAENIYLVRVNDSANTLDMANRLYEDPDVLYAHPNFYKKVQKR